jgi:hypothetical protein
MYCATMLEPAFRVMCNAAALCNLLIYPHQLVKGES